MNQIYINGKRVDTPHDKLKQVLSENGMNFPCQGKGICGKCKIICTQLAPTGLDKRFLSPVQLEEGKRLACDKEVKSGLKIYFTETQEKPKERKLDYCNIAAVIDAHRFIIGILDDQIAEERVFINNIEESHNKKIYLRSLIAKECIELFEKYGVAKADTIALSINSSMTELLLNEKNEGYGEMFDAQELMLPAETLYILPFVNDDIAGDFLCYASMQKAPCLIIKANKDFTAGLLTDQEMFCISHKNVDYTNNDLIALETSIKLLLKETDRAPIFKIYGEQVEQLKDILDEYAYVFEDLSDAEITSGVLTDNRLKNKIFKLRKKVSILPTVDNDEWQELFVLSANNTNNSHNTVF